MRSEMKMVVFSTAVVGMVAATAVIPAQADTAFFWAARMHCIGSCSRFSASPTPTCRRWARPTTTRRRRTRPSSTIPAPPGSVLPGLPTVGESVSDGQGQLDEELKNSSGPVTVVGLSEGTPVIDAEQASLANDPNAPPEGHHFRRDLRSGLSRAAWHGVPRRDVHPRADRLHRAWAGGKPVQHHRHHRQIRPCR